jgi:beta-fructofuranosidase
VAISSDTDLRTWHKLDKPIIESPPADKKITGFRDPFSWKEGETWYAGVGSGFEQEGGAVLLYRSKDARRWEYLHPLAQGTWNGQSFSNPVPSGEMWECPDFFALGEKHVLIYSTENKTFWEVGTFDRRELRFHSERKGLLDYGKYYAPKSMMDRRGRRVLWGWVQETRSSDETKRAGWAGAMSLPRLLTLNSENELQMNVAPELDKLCRDTVIVRRKSKKQDLSRALCKTLIQNRSGKVVCTFKAGQQACGLELRIGAGSEETTLLTTSYVYSSGPSCSIMVDAHALPLHPNEQVLSTIEIWLDGSIIEVFLDSREAFTTRCYSVSHTGDIRPMWNGSPDTLESLTVSTLAPISDDRLTT